MAARGMLADLRTLVAEPHFPRLYGTRLVSQAADGALQVSLAGAVFFTPEHAASASAAAVGFAVLLLPYSLVGPFAGVLLDRWRRQRTLVAVSAVRACTAAAVAAILLRSGPSGWAFVLTALVAISLNRFFLSGLAAALPHVVPRHLLVPANSLCATSGLLATLLGALSAMALRTVAAAPAGPAADAAGALAAAAAYLLTARVAAGFPDARLLGPDVDLRPVRASQAVLDVVAGVGAGARHVWSRRPAAYALAAVSANRFLYGLTTIATLLLYRNYFQSDGIFRAGLVGLGQVVLASGLGVLAAAVLTPPATAALGTPRWITGLLALAAVVSAGLGLPYTLPALVLGAFLLGFVAQGVKISVDATLQSTIEDGMRGRVFACYDTAFNLTFVAAAGLAAAVLPPSGKSPGVVLAVAGGYAAIAATYAVASRPGGAADLSATRGEVRAAPAPVAPAAP